VVSTSAGNTSAVAITGWTVPVISFQNGNDGSPGSAGSRGPFTTYAAIGYPGWDSATAYAAIMAMPNNQSTLVVGDEVTLCYPNTTTPTWVLTQYVATIGNPGTWSVRGQVIDGNLMVTGTLSAASLKTSNLSASTSITVGTVNDGLILSSIDNTFKVKKSSANRVTMGNLGTTYGIQGWDNATRSVFKLDENGLDAKITQPAVNLFGGSYHNRLIADGDYTFYIYGNASETVVIPIPIITTGMFRLKVQITGYWENDAFNSGSYAAQAMWREMSMGVYYKNAHTASSLTVDGYDKSTIVGMTVVSESSGTTQPTNFPVNRANMRVNSTTAATLVPGQNYTITTVGNTNWNAVSGGDLSTPYLIGDSFTAQVVGTGTGVASTGYPELVLASAVGTNTYSANGYPETANNTTAYSYLVWAIDNIAYPFEVF
jgi:hypothetical protein